MISIASLPPRGRGPVPVQFVPVRGLHWEATQGIWVSTDEDALFRADLGISIKPAAGGWVLIRGVLRSHGMRRMTCLRVEVAGKPDPISIRIPVSVKGTVLELICLPSKWHSIYMQPLGAEGSFELEQWSARSIGLIERTVRRVQRMLPIYRKLTYTVRRRLGFRLRSLITHTPSAHRVMADIRDACAPMDYPLWVQRFHGLQDIDTKLIRKQIEHWPDKPVFKIFVTGEQEEALQTTLASLHHQLYQQFEILQCTDVAAFAALAQRHIFNADWYVFLVAGTSISEHALYWLAYEARQWPDATIIYTDHDFFGPDQIPQDPVFKPDWSPQLLCSTNYIGSAVAYRTKELAKELEAVDKQLYHGQNHDLLFRLCEVAKPKHILHIPAPLWHFPINQANRAATEMPEPDPVSRHLKRIGAKGNVISNHNDYYHIRYDISDPKPKVSIIIPTRDAFEHLKACIESVLKKSSYDNFEIFIVDNKTTDSAAIAYLNSLRSHRKIRILSYEKEFNYSAINNWAVSHSDGSVLCLLNNDTEVITPDWIEEMLGYLVQPEVGVVGAKLLFDDGSVQHAGDVVGVGGCATHLHANLPKESEGYCARAVLAQDLSAVTGACLMTWRHLYIALNGLDADKLPVAFNDVDYCLRVREAGRRVVWTPHAQLYHHESISRGADTSRKQRLRAKAEVAYMRRRWGEAMHHDPFYNPNLNYQRADFSFSGSPRIHYPWWQ
ncbi:glycosyltransferase [Allopusillimonas soli]|uniref:Glycosyltransferase n=1 Tax=Allopusillimonas soli TaxID=659016 RepID=A0A853FD22_9BURK|nr:glycosyltransferase family 2 protein [Allopusillimonas soli]NYT36441.1 glycosyltransferase [Allopusillimonas soli]TEA74950.1 glycosyltransferase [Allopusillimonas soli]